MHCSPTPFVSENILRPKNGTLERTRPVFKCPGLVIPRCFSYPSNFLLLVSSLFPGVASSLCDFFLWILALVSLSPCFVPDVPPASVFHLVSLKLPAFLFHRLLLCFPGFDSLSLAHSHCACLPFWLILPPTPSHGFSSLPLFLSTCRNSSYLNQ